MNTIKTVDDVSVYLDSLYVDIETQCPHCVANLIGRVKMCNALDLMLDTPVYDKTVNLLALHELLRMCVAFSEKGLMTYEDGVWVSTESMCRHDARRN